MCVFNRSVHRVVNQEKPNKQGALNSLFGVIFKVSKKILVWPVTSVLVVSLPQVSLSAQSLDGAVNDALANNCSAIGSPVGHLQTVCAADGTALSGTGGSLNSLVGVTTTEKKRLSADSVEANAGVGEEEDPRYIYGVGRLNVFASIDYERHKKDETSIEGNGFESDKQALLLGADYALNNQTLLGLAFNYSTMDGDFDGSDNGGFDTDGYGLQFNGSFTPVPNWFLDVYLGYANFDHEIDRYADSRIMSMNDPTVVAESAEGILSGDTDSKRLSAGANAGYDITWNSFQVGPRFSVNFVKTDIDGYREGIKSGDPLPLIYEAQSERSLTAHLGLQISKAYSWERGVLVPQAMLELVHEFKDDQRNIDFSFVDDSSATKFTFNNDQPDRNYATLMLGLSSVFRNGVQAFVNYEGLLAYDDHANYRLTAGVRLEL